MSSKPQKIEGTEFVCDVPEGFDHCIFFKDKFWQQVEATYLIAVNSKTGEQMTRQITPELKDWKKTNIVKKMKRVVVKEGRVVVGEKGIIKLGGSDEKI